MGDQIKRKIDTQQRYTTQYSYARMLRKESIIALSSIQSKRSNYLELCGRLNDKEQDTSMHDLHSLTNTSPVQVQSRFCCCCCCFPGCMLLGYSSLDYKISE